MRKSFDQVFLEMTAVLAQRGSCARRQVACILVDKGFRIIGSGYNGKAAGLPNCRDAVEHECEGARLSSGTGLDLCGAIHAEANALMYCSDVREIHTCYTTCSPCISCIKMLLGTACQRVVFSSEYPHAESRKMWEDAGREWVLINEVS